MQRISKEVRSKSGWNGLLIRWTPVPRTTELWHKREQDCKVVLLAWGPLSVVKQLKIKESGVCGGLQAPASRLQSSQIEYLHLIETNKSSRPSTDDGASAATHHSTHIACRLEKGPEPDSLRIPKKRANRRSCWQVRGLAAATKSTPTQIERLLRSHKSARRFSHADDHIIEVQNLASRFVIHPG